MPDRPMTDGERDQLAVVLEGFANDVHRLDRSQIQFRIGQYLQLVVLVAVLAIGLTNRQGVQILIDCTTPSTPTERHVCSDRANAQTAQAIKEIQDGIICRFSQLFVPNRPEPPECSPGPPAPLPTQDRMPDPWAWTIPVAIVALAAIPLVAIVRWLWERRSLRGRRRA